ncbi:MAG: MFS transporter [Candidatus Kariarchaeaceae archaeon]
MLLTDRYHQSSEYPLKLVPIIALGFIATQLAWSLFDIAIPVILKDHFDKSLSTIGFIMSWDNIVALFFLPIIGLYSDQVRTRIGRRLPFIIPGILISAILFALLPLAKSSSLLVFLVIIMLFNISMAIYRSPAISLMPDFISSERRSMGNAIGNLVGGIAAAISLLGAGALLDAGHTNAAFWSMSGGMLLCLLVLISLIKEPDLENLPETSSQSVFVQFREEIQEMASSVDKSLLYMLAAICSWFIALNAILAFYSTYVWKVFLPELDSEKAAGQASKILFIFPIVFIGFSLLGGYLGIKIGRMKTMKIGILTLLIGLILSSFIAPDSTLGIALDWKVAFNIVFIITAIGWGFTNVNSIVVIWEHTKDNGIGTGLYYAFSNTAAIIGPIAAGIGMEFIHIKALFPISIFFVILSAVFLFKVQTGEAGYRENVLSS